MPRPDNHLPGEVYDTAQSLIRAVSGCSPKRAAEAVAAALIDDHRTCQQDFVRMVRDVLVIYSEAESDARNEASVGFAKFARGWPYGFPYI